jgi:hypothetical protein
MSLDEYTDEQERLSRLEAIVENAEWVQENWEDAESEVLAQRLGLIKGDVQRLVQMTAEKRPSRADSSTADFED